MGAFPLALLIIGAYQQQPSQAGLAALTRILRDEAIQVPTLLHRALLDEVRKDRVRDVAGVRLHG
jgi:hypothetical protein